MKTGEPGVKTFELGKYWTVRISGLAKVESFRTGFTGWLFQWDGFWGPDVNPFWTFVIEVCNFQVIHLSVDKDRHQLVNPEPPSSDDP